MATITQRRLGKYQVRVRKEAYPVQSQTFSSKKTAQKWARKIESEMEQGVFLDCSKARNTLLSQLLDRYESEILPKKKSQQPVRSLIGTLKQELGYHNLASITPTLLSQHRDYRLQSVSNETARKDLHFLQRVFNTATKEWGFKYILSELLGML
ncbi:MAG: Shufflon-specific DNA recombinase [Candidatus Thiodiazotropha sp. (ex Lucinoma borealis)]|nr:Shufflon-specific DNA recombinase [Candidatus Thiodiazotropha sp. (ex Lucinoma borealis)]